MANGLNLDPEELERIQRERNRQKAASRLKSVSGGDFPGAFSNFENLSNREVSQPKSARPVSPAPNVAPKTPQKTKDKSKPDVVTKPAKSRKNEPTNEEVVDVIAKSSTVNRRSRRNKLIIAILLVLLILIWIFVFVTQLMSKKDVEANCHMYLGGNASENCELLLNGESETDWTTPSGIAPNVEYRDIEIGLKINADGTYVVRYRVELYNDGKLVQNFGDIESELHSEAEEIEGTNWNVIQNVSGNQTISILTGLVFKGAFDNAEMKGLSTKTIEIKLYVEVDPVA